MKSTDPETRNSLIMRLPNQCDQDAWGQFVAIYDPLIYRLARMKGFQDADARELVQEVLLAVSKAVHRWEPDKNRGRFRDWLFRIARNLMINFMTRRKHQSIASGDADFAALLDQQIDPASEQSALFDLEYGRQMFHWASDRVREQVTPQTWRAFWKTTVEGHSVPSTATELGMSTGAVHIARSRVLGRLRLEVIALEQEQCDGSIRRNVINPGGES
jgi:RNA polymerase sigma-70 factor (ECF subfamily)